jgi:hypothetical protein
MNWWADLKRNSWLVFVLLGLVGCRDDNMGLELPPELQRSVLKSVEFTLPATNVYFDSLRTDHGARVSAVIASTILVGEFSDAVFGSINAKSFVEFRYRSGKFPPDTTTFRVSDNQGNQIHDGDADKALMYDSAYLYLRIKGVASPDNFLNMNIAVTTLLDSIYSNTLYLSNRVIPSGDILGTTNFSLANLSSIDFAKDTVLLSVKLDDQYGQEVFDLMLDNPTNFSRLQLPGFSIESTSANGLLEFELFDGNSNLEIFMSNPDSVRDEKSVKLLLSNSHHLTNISRNRSGSLFTSIQNKDNLDPDNDYVYFNPLAGIVPRLDLSEFLTWVESQENIVVQQALLTIPVDSEDIVYPQVPFTCFFFSKSTTPYNVNWPGQFFSPQKTLVQSDRAYQAGLRQHLFHSYISSKSYYKGTMTLFFQILLELVQKDDELWTTNFVLMSENPYALGRAKIPRSGIKLKIFYAELND